MKFDFRIADSGDDPDIRRLLSRTPMPGRVTVAFHRDPDYFLGTTVMGDNCRVYIARSGETGELALIGCFAVSDRFLSGKRVPVAYIGQLRVGREFRGYMLPAAGRAFLEKTLKPEDPDICCAVISRENITARSIFTGSTGRHFPVLREIDTICTCAVPLGRARKTAGRGISIEEGSAGVLPEIVDFFHTWGSRKEFFPVYTEEDFLKGVRTRGFDPNNFRIARSGREILGVAGLWDQSGFKQSVLCAYGGMLKAARPVYNLFSPLLGRPVLPEPGSYIDEVYASFICVRDNDPDIFRVLLNSIYSLARAEGHAWLLVGLASRDPLLEPVKSYPHILYTAGLYGFSFSGTSASLETMSGGIPYIEIAAL